MRHRILISALFSLILIGFSAGSAQAKRKYPRFEWGLRVSAAAVYNDNLLRFSDRDMNRFRNHDSDFHTPVESLDDFENEFSIRPSFLWRAPRRMMVTGYYNFKTVHRQRNRITDYQTHTLSLAVRPRVRGYRWKAQVRTFIIPSYYLRVYRDRDYNEQHAARFENWDYDGVLSLRISGSWWFSASAAYGTYYYNEMFTEYDSEYSEAGLRSSIALPGKFSLNAGYLRRVSNNVGKDQFFSLTSPADQTLTDEDSEYGDADFNEDEFNIRLRRPLTFIKFVIADASLSYRLRRRVYTTDRGLVMDPFHRGRLDNRFQITPSVDLQVTPALNLEVYYVHEERDTESDLESVLLAKEFVRRETGITLSYSLK